MQEFGEKNNAKSMQFEQMQWDETNCGDQIREPKSKECLWGKHLACIISNSKIRVANTFLCANVVYQRGLLLWLLARGHWCLVAGNKSRIISALG